MISGAHNASFVKLHLIGSTSVESAATATVSVPQPDAALIRRPPGASRMKRILQSKLYQSLAAGRNDIELWEDNQVVDGWTLFSIVSRRQGDATILAELRFNDDHVQRRVVADHGDEQWLAVE